MPETPIFTFYLNGERGNRFKHERRVATQRVHTDDCPAANAKDSSMTVLRAHHTGAESDEATR